MAIEWPYLRAGTGDLLQLAIGRQLSRTISSSAGVYSLGMEYGRTMYTACMSPDAN